MSKCALVSVYTYVCSTYPEFNKEVKYCHKTGSYVSLSAYTRACKTMTI